MSKDDKTTRYSYDFDMDSFLKAENAKVTEKCSDTKNKKKRIIYASIAAGVLIIAALAIILGSRSRVLEKNTIEFNEDCFNMFFGEYEGIGEVKVTPNYAEIRKVVMDVFEGKDYDEEELEEQFLLFYDEIDISARLDGELVNGNMVNVTIEVNDEVLKEHNVAIGNTEFTVEISGLESAMEVNPFEYMQVYSKGTTRTNDMYKIFFTYPEEYYGLTSSDFIQGYNNSTENYSIEISPSAIMRLERQGIVPTKTEYVFKLSEVDGVLVRDFNEIYDSIFENIKLDAEATIRVMYEDDPEVTLEKMEYYGGWLSINDYLFGGSELELIYKTTVSHKAGLIEPITLYIKVTYNNIVNVDGDIKVLGDNANVVKIPAYVQVGDESYYMGIGVEDYADYLSDVLLFGDIYTVIFDQRGNITQYQ